MRNTVAVLSAFAAASLATPAAAGSGHDPAFIVAHIFEMSDLDGNGVIDVDEFAKAGMKRFGAPFESYDENADDEISRDEFAALYERHHPTPSDDVEA